MPFSFFKFVSIMVKTLNIGGEERPANLNGLALEIIADLTGQDFTSFFTSLQIASQDGRFDIRAVNVLLFACLKGGALEADTPFNFSREKVATWVTLANIGEVLENVMLLVTAALPSEPPGEGEKKSKATR